MLAANLGPTQFTCSPWYSSPSSDSVRHCDGIRELSFCLDCLSKANLSSTKDSQNCFTTYYLVLALANIWPHSSSLFVKKGPLFLPIPLYRSEEFCTRLSSDHRPWEQVPEHLPAIATENREPRRHMPPSVIRARRRRGQMTSTAGQTSFSPLHAEVTKKLTKFFWWLKKVLIVTAWPIILILD